MKISLPVSLSLVFLLWGSLAHGQDSTSAASTIVQLSERSATLTEVSEHKYRQPLEAIRATLRERVAEAVEQREQLAADPANRGLQAQLENTLSVTFTELDRHMATLHEGRDEMLDAVDANVQVIRQLRSELQDHVKGQVQQRDSAEQRSNQLDGQLDHAAERLGPLLAAGEAIPENIDTLVQKIASDLQVNRQQAGIAAAATRQLQAADENLRRFETLLADRRARLEVAYHAIEGQRVVISSLVDYRKQRLHNERLAHELGTFAQGISDLTRGLGEVDLTQLGSITIGESESPQIVNFGDEAKPRGGTLELQRRYQQSQTSNQVVHQER